MARDCERRNSQVVRRGFRGSRSGLLGLGQLTRPPVVPTTAWAGSLCKDCVE